jgi:uncharacterized oligopeptide transporter (OPT) family protein
MLDLVNGTTRPRVGTAASGEPRDVSDARSGAMLSSGLILGKSARGVLSLLGMSRPGRLDYVQ